MGTRDKSMREGTQSRTGFLLEKSHMVTYILKESGVTETELERDKE